MNLLAVDTSTTSCSVALFNGERLLAEEVHTAGGTHSRHLLSIIHRVLSGAGCSPAEIGGCGVTRGPGTFTGLRIGISTVKGLAAATRAPVVGVSSLDALAFPLARMGCPVVAMIDARRGEVYHAHYRCGIGKMERSMPAAVDAPEAVAASIPEDAILVGSGALLYHEVLKNRCPHICLADPGQHVIRAASVGMLAMARFKQHDTDPIETLIPDYIRKSDAPVQTSGSC